MIRTAITMTSLLSLLAFSTPASAHCDTTRGPVVTAARQALEVGDANRALHWVRPEDEAVVRAVFEHTMKVRALGPEAKELSERHLFETLVRVHRAGEGAPYTGLSEGEPEPIILAADRALERGSTEELELELVSAVKRGLAERFAAARAAKDFRPGDVAGGRAFVSAYVPLTHWVEGVFTASTGAGIHHADPQSGSAHTVDHAPRDHESRAGKTNPHDSGGHEVLPWLVAGVLAIAALVEGVFLLRRRRPAASGA